MIAPGKAAGDKIVAGRSALRFSRVLISAIGFLCNRSRVWSQPAHVARRVCAKADAGRWIGLTAHSSFRSETALGEKSAGIISQILISLSEPIGFLDGATKVHASQ